MYIFFYGNILIYYKLFRDNKVLDIINKLIIEYEIYIYYFVRMEGFLYVINS